MEINFKYMKTRLMLAALFAAVTLPVASSAQNQADPEGYLTYSLPSTVLVLDVEAVCENFYAGPYAAYAEKYLGITVPQEDKQTCQLKSIKMVPYVEPDHSERFSINVPKGDVDASFLKLSSAGLISFGDGGFGGETAWHFPVAGKSDFSDKGVSSNLMSESATLYRNNDAGSRYSEMMVQQEVVVEKSLEKKAAEAAQKLLDAREERYKIVVGDTDATYSGEALQAAIDELTRLEKEFLTLFVGYTQTQIQKVRFEVMPQAGEMQKYVAFRLSDNYGLVPSDNISGKPILLEVIPQEFAKTDLAKAEETAAAEAQAQLEATGKAPKSKAPAEKQQVLAYYRIPAICTVNVKNGDELLLQSRVPIYQLGQESSLPVNVIL